jgi:cytochrome oxidase Cu insertion factor (SCO1/SenC/PrrC family)
MGRMVLSSAGTNNLRPLRPGFQTGCKRRSRRDFHLLGPTPYGLRIRSPNRPLTLVTILIGALLLAGLAAWLLAGTAGSASPDPPSPSIGDTLNQPVPQAIAQLPLENQEGQRVTLDQFRGRAVLLVPFLTSCQEECPITTGALLVAQRSISAADLSKKAVIIEVTVDPARDTPSRMAAFARLTGSTWPLLTGSSATLARFWHHFGIYYQKVPEGSPPGINWQNDRPYAYDVDHSDGFVLVDTHLRERFIAGGMTSIGRIPMNLQRLLDSQGRADLRNPGGGTWTVTDALNAVGWVLGRGINVAT